MNCKACGKKLVLALEGHAILEEDSTQFEDALEIQFNDGYGMYIDPNSQKHFHVFICHDCADELCTRAPWVKQLIEDDLNHEYQKSEIPTFPTEQT